MAPLAPACADPSNDRPACESRSSSCQDRATLCHRQHVIAECRGRHVDRTHRRERAACWRTAKLPATVGNERVVLNLFLADSAIFAAREQPAASFSGEPQQHVGMTRLVQWTPASQRAATKHADVAANERCRLRLERVVWRSLAGDQSLEQGDAFGGCAVLADAERVAEPCPCDRPSWPRRSRQPRARLSLIRCGAPARITSPITSRLQPALCVRNTSPTHALSLRPRSQACPAPRRQVQIRRRRWSRER